MPNDIFPKDGLTDLSKGEDVSSDLALIPYGYSQKLENFEYIGGNLRRRPALVDYNVNTLSGDSSNITEYNGGIVSTNLDGSIQEVPTSGAVVNRVTGLTTSKRGSFSQLSGALFHQNGTDLPRRGDSSTYRIAGVPAVTTLTGGAKSAGAVTGSYAWIVTACVKDATLGIVILESDWSNIVTDTLAAQQKAFTWTASADARVNWYRLYRVKDGQGGPYYLVYEANATSYTDNTIDTALSAQLADDIGLNGEMPKSYYLTACGQRLVCAKLVASSTDPQAESAFWLSRIDTNGFKMESYPRDGLHKIYLPGKGPLTCAYPYSIKDEFQNAKDLFVSQANSCYILRKAEPNGVLETVSTEVGVIGPDAIVQWSRYLFFISRQGLIFYSPEMGPILISKQINPKFLGGGALNLPNYNRAEYYKIAVDGNRLLIAYTTQVSITNADKLIVMDLERFNPSQPVTSSHFTTWSVTGAELAQMCRTETSGLYVCDNVGRRIMKLDPAAVNDKINNVGVVIQVEYNSGGLLAGNFMVWKTLRRINILQITDTTTTLTLSFDYGLRGSQEVVIDPVSAVVDWDKDWDKLWGLAYSFISTKSLSPRNNGYILQVKIKLTKAATVYGLFGYSFALTTNARKNVGKI